MRLKKEKGRKKATNIVTSDRERKKDSRFSTEKH